MAENRCPMCGKVNPPELEVCQFCEARLKPLISPEPPEEEPAVPQPPPPGAEEPADWLSDLRMDTESGMDDSGDWDSGETSSEDSSDEAEWLRRLKGQDEPEQDEAEETPAEPEEERDELLARLAQMGDEDQQPPEETTESLPWDAEPPPEEEEPLPAPAEPAWLEEHLPPEEPLPSEDEPEIPEEAVETREIPELTVEEPGEEEPPQPDWLGDLASEDADGGEEEPLPDWLQTSGPEPQPEAQEPDAEEEELPDWLQSPGLEPEPGLEAVADEEGEDLPDWLQESPSPGAPREPVDTQELPELGEQEVPETTPEAEPAPDWLAEIGSPGQEESQAPLALEEGDVPDWLRGLDAVQEEAATEAGGAILADVDAEMADLEGDQQEEVPGWLAELQAKTPEIPAEPLEPAERPAEPAEEVEPAGHMEPSTEIGPPPDLPEIAPELPVEPEEELPGWIAEISEEARSLEAEQVEHVEDELDLTPAELPDWLKAMRPVEALAPVPPQAERPDEEVEDAGPLAGLQGVLPAEPEIVQAGTPPVFSAKVSVSENQQQHINLVKELLKSETEPRPLRRRGVVQPQRILRWVIAAGLLLAILWPLLTGGSPAPTPALFPPETLAFRQVVASLPDQAPVLVAFEYQPALAGELDAASAAALDHLMIRNARLTLVSTLPAGPALAERTLTDPRGVGGHAYQPGQDYINLGYLPGQAAGLLRFALDPRGVLPAPFTRLDLPEGLTAWDAPPLQGVAGLADFALVVVLVDDADTARAWVEQVGPRLGETPLMMVISAQAEPLVRPYFESTPRQVAGLVTGLLGATPYEASNSQLDGRSQLARGSWTAFSNGLLVAVALILIGGAYYLGTGLLARTEQAPVEEQA